MTLEDAEVGMCTDSSNVLISSLPFSFFSFRVQLFQHLSGTFNHLHLITSAEVLREVLIKIALWSGITGKSLGKEMWRYKIEALICRLTFKSLLENSAGVNPNILSLGQVYFKYSSRGCTHLTTLC